MSYNDTKERQRLKITKKYDNDIRSEKVTPDGVGSTGWKPLGGGNTLIFPETTFYEVKSGGTALDANYSTDNPKQLSAMLNALKKINAQANFYGTPTLFLITPNGTPVNLSAEAALQQVNLVQITPSLLSTGEISFSNANILYAVPGGPLSGYVKGIKLPFFNTPVPLRWTKKTTANDAD